MSVAKTSPPNNTKAEANVLSCMLLACDVGDDLSDKLIELERDDFYDLRNQNIFLKLEQLSKHGKPIVSEDLLSCADKLGGREYIVSLLDECPSTKLWPHHLKELKDASVKRLHYQFGQKLMQSSQNIGELSGKQIEEIYESVSGLGTGKSKLPPVVDAAHLVKADISTPPELVKGILHQASKMVVAGSSKSYKTFILLDLAASVSSGMDFWGIPTTKGKVLFINLEMQEFAIQKRIKNICAAKDVCLDEGTLDIFNLRGHSKDISTLKNELMPDIRRSKPDMIIIDPIYKIMGERDENSVSNIMGMMNELESIAVETGAAVVFGNHYPKGNQAGKQSIDRISGSGVFARDPDAILNLTKHDEDDCLTVETTLRNFPPLKSFVMRWDCPLMVRDDTLDPKQLKQNKGVPAKQHTIEEILAHVPVTGSIEKNDLRLKVHKAGIALNKINPLIDKAIDEETLYEWGEPRPGTNPKKIISRQPQPEETLETCTT